MQKKSTYSKEFRDSLVFCVRFSWNNNLKKENLTEMNERVSSTEIAEITRTKTRVQLHFGGVFIYILTIKKLFN